MKAPLLIVSAVLLAGSLGACTGSDSTDSSVPPSSPASAGGAGAGTAGAGAAAAADQVLAQAEEGQDLGNGRPEVSYDGLMVRRRVVIAVHSGLDANLEGVRAELDAAAAARTITLEAIPPTVLEPAVLQHVTPELIVALPVGTTLDDGQALVDHVFGDGAGEETKKMGAEHFHVLPALVHDLTFTVRTPDPAALSASVDREGILSDALGNYGTAVDGGKVAFSYTGPLLGDGTVESVRAGVARQAHVAASAVAVGPRSLAGAGVDMAAEPPWDPEVIEEKPGHQHR